MSSKSNKPLEHKLAAYFKLSDVVQKQNQIRKLGIPFAAGALASLGLQASAGVVLTDVNPDQDLSGFGASYRIDFNGDGSDLLIQRDFSPYQGVFVYTARRANSALSGPFYSSPITFTTTWGSKIYTTSRLGYPFDKTVSSVIGPGGNWKHIGLFGAGILTSKTDGVTHGFWKNKSNKYLGVRFNISGSIHYAWVELSVNSNANTVTIHRYAYESTAGLGIKAGSDTSLPVEFSQLTAVQEDDNVKLSWSTESETDNLGFIIERKISNSGWSEIASYLTDDGLVSAGNTSSKSEYIFVDDDVQSGETYSYRISDVSNDGTLTVKDVISITMETLPLMTDLLPASPNPFNPTTKIQYTLAKKADVALKVVDMTGRTVQNIFTGENQRAGSYSVHWNGETEQGQKASSGIYFLVLQADEILKTQKVMLVR